MKLDKEEKIILEAYKKGKIRAEYLYKKRIEEVKAAVKKYIQKNRSIIIRLHDQRFISPISFN